MRKMQTGESAAVARTKFKIGSPKTKFFKHLIYKQNWLRPAWTYLE
jgi:hypothetical protein